jgi:hypothetical protein
MLTKRDGKGTISPVLVDHVDEEVREGHEFTRAVRKVF